MITGHLLQVDSLSGIFNNQKPMENANSDLEIINKVVAGELQSFEEIVKRYQERVLRLCYSMVGESQAEDAAQDIFIKVYQSLRQFRGKSSFSTWIYRVTSNHCLNILSKKKRERTESLEALMERSGDRFPAATGDRSPLNLLENKQFVRSVLEQMSPEERMILSLREMEGLNYKELSETLDISLDLVKIRLFRARQSFSEFAKIFL